MENINEIFKQHIKDEVLTDELQKDINTLWDAQMNLKTSELKEALEKELEEKLAEKDKQISEMKQEAEDILNEEAEKMQKAIDAKEKECEEKLAEKDRQISEMKQEAEDILNEEAGKLEDEKENCESKLESKYVREAKKQYDELVNKTSSYIDESAKEVVRENKIKVYNAVMVEKCKSMIEGFKKVFEENGVEIPESDKDLVHKLYEKISELEEKISILIQDKHELEEENQELEKALTFINGTQDLSEMDKKKCLNMMDGIQTESISDFKSKLNLIKRNLVSERKVALRREEKDWLLDEVEDVTEIEKEGCETKRETKSSDVDKAMERLSKSFITRK